MRILLVFVVLAAAFGGCLDADEAPPEAEPFPLEVYRFEYEGSDVAVPGVEHGWLIRMTNPTQTTYRTTILPFGLQEALLGPIGRTDGPAPQEVFLPARIEGGQATAPPALELEPGQSGIFLVRVAAYEGDEGDTVQTGFRAFAAPADQPSELSQDVRVAWPVVLGTAATGVRPGDHVQTVTVGVWTNGTSFYTNSADLLADPLFPAGFDREATDTAPLPVYVYDEDRSEQPARSQDTCHFTTVPGYNDLLKSQADGSTGIRLLRPEEGYTREGNEDHFLYGHSLVFLNTVIAHDGATGPLDLVPDPMAPCFGDRLEGLPLPGSA